jgi:hypothetical protein
VFRSQDREPTVPKVFSKKRHRDLWFMGATCGRLGRTVEHPLHTEGIGKLAVVRAPGLHP